MYTYVIIYKKTRLPSRVNFGYFILFIFIEIVIAVLGSGF